MQPDGTERPEWSDKMEPPAEGQQPPEGFAPPQNDIPAKDFTPPEGADHPEKPGDNRPESGNMGSRDLTTEFVIHDGGNMFGGISYPADA